MECDLNEDIDINDVFDDIALSEEKIVQNSFQEGLSKGVLEGEIEGFHLGYHRGSEIGSEIGFYSGFVDILISISTLKEDFPQKGIVILTKLKNLLLEFPRSNVEDCDMVQLLENIRSLYKKLCVMLKIDCRLPMKDELSF
ncbi:protein LTO1 homolog [Nilaparvata lugens]|uniref:protein LTO1 homolog n=1 Tax=Nilaparvata lugens TaxID=108931 RepID=UPI000B97FC14|nr:protein LTO1 homolog [Nilaparvata lugens]